MRLAASACSPSGSAPGSARTCEHANRGEHPLFACSLLCPAEKTEPRRVPRRIATFWWQPTHAARAETACGLCRARRRKTSVAKLKAPKPSACRFSREQPPARVERAQQEQDYAASLSGHAGCRLFFLRCKRECGGLKPLPGAIVGFCAFCLSRTHPSRRVSRRTIPARCRSCETKARLKVVRNGAGLLANPRIGARFER